MSVTAPSAERIRQPSSVSIMGLRVSGSRPRQIGSLIEGSGLVKNSAPGRSGFSSAGDQRVHRTPSRPRPWSSGCRAEGDEQPVGNRCGSVGDLHAVHRDGLAAQDLQAFPGHQRRGVRSGRSGPGCRCALVLISQVSLPLSWIS